MIIYIILVKLTVFLVFCAWLNRRNINKSQGTSIGCNEKTATDESSDRLTQNIASIKQSQKLAVGFKEKKL